MTTMKEIGVSLERQHKTQMVNELEAEYLELLKTYEECANISTAIDSVGNKYRPSEQGRIYVHINRFKEVEMKNIGLTWVLLPRTSPPPFPLLRLQAPPLIHRLLREDLWYRLVILLL